MAVTATLESKAAQLADANVKVTVVVTDTERGSKRLDWTLAPEDATTANIIARVKQFVARVQAAIAAEAALPAPGASINVTPDPPPTPEDPAVVAARETWLANYSRLRVGKQLVADGVLQVDNPDLVALQTSVNNGFLLAYVEHLR